MNRIVLSLLLAAGWLILFAFPFWRLIGLAWNSATHTHILMIPLVSFYLIFINRKAVFSDCDMRPAAGILLLVLSLSIFITGLTLAEKLSVNDYLFLTTLAGVVYFYGLFVWLAGWRAFHSAAFSLLFLLFMVPLPEFLLDVFIVFLQLQTADMTDLIFTATRIPVFRDGVVFELSNTAVEVAKQCAGIRSSIVLIISGVLMGNIYLNSYWRRFALAAAAIPITIFKNSLRIVLLSLLGNYVDISWLTDSALHSRGGIPFLILALSFLFGVMKLLQIGEKGNDGLKAAGDRRELMVVR